MPNRRFLTSTKAAEYLGVSRPTIYKLADAREVTVYKISGTYRFTREDLDAYLARVKVPSKHASRAARRPRRSR